MGSEGGEEMRSARGVVVVAVLVAMVAGVGAWADEEKKMDGSGETAPVLLVIDIQEFYFEGGFLALDGPVAASERAGEIVKRFRSKGWPVIHVQHLPQGVEEPDPRGIEPAQYRIHGNVAPVNGEKVVGKHHANSFRDTELLEVLRGLGAEKVVITGMQTHMCVEAATRAAADLGFEVSPDPRCGGMDVRPVGLDSGSPAADP